MRRMNRQGLVASVRVAVTDPAMAVRARRPGGAVAAERGVDTACDVIEEWATGKGITAATV
jgi:O-mycaminosyltylonolide 6-deoxyallosyltransferase